jgi:hypothetical protein
LLQEGSEIKVNHVHELNTLHGVNVINLEIGITFPRQKELFHETELVVNVHRDIRLGVQEVNAFELVTLLTHDHVRADFFFHFLDAGENAVFDIKAKLRSERGEWMRVDKRPDEVFGVKLLLLNLTFTSQDDIVFGLTSVSGSQLCIVTQRNKIFEETLTVNNYDLLPFLLFVQCRFDKSQDVMETYFPGKTIIPDIIESNGLCGKLFNGIAIDSITQVIAHVKVNVLSHFFFAMKRAVLIAISYSGTPQELFAPERDATAIYNLLQREGYNTENILVLSEQNVSPTHRNILQAWKWLYTDATASSFSSTAVYVPTRKVLRAFVYYSGHGMQIPDSSRDEDDGKDECLIPLDYKQYGVLTDDVIKAHLVESLPSSSSLFTLFDACNSGSGCDLPWNYYRYSSPATYTVFHDKYADGKQDVCCIAAALDSELAYEVNNASVLTSRFLASYKRGVVLKYLIKSMQETVNQQTFVLSTAREKDLDASLQL